MKDFLQYIFIIFLISCIAISAIDSTIDICTIVWKHRKQEALQEEYIKGFECGVAKTIEKITELANEYKEKEK